MHSRISNMLSINETKRSLSPETLTQNGSTGSLSRLCKTDYNPCGSPVPPNIPEVSGSHVSSRVHAHVWKRRQTHPGRNRPSQVPERRNVSRWPRMTTAPCSRRVGFTIALTVCKRNSCDDYTPYTCGCVSGAVSYEVNRRMREACPWERVRSSSGSSEPSFIVCERHRYT
jgi:hypothetical protein